MLRFFSLAFYLTFLLPFLLTFLLLFIFLLLFLLLFLFFLESDVKNRDARGRDLNREFDGARILGGREERRFIIPDGAKN